MTGPRDFNALGDPGDPAGFEGLLQGGLSPAQMARIRANRAAAEEAAARQQWVNEVTGSAQNPAGTPMERILSPRDVALATSFLAAMQARDWPGVTRMTTPRRSTTGWSESVAPWAVGYQIGFVSTGADAISAFSVPPYLPNYMEHPDAIPVFLCTDGRLRTTSIRSYRELAGSIPQSVQGNSAYYQSVQPFKLVLTADGGYMRRVTIGPSGIPGYDVTVFRTTESVEPAYEQPSYDANGLPHEDVWEPLNYTASWQRTTLEQRLIQLGQQHIQGIDPKDLASR